MTFNLPNFTQERFVVEHYKSGDNWYRVWSDGWVDQGGRIYASPAIYTSDVTFLKAFTTTDYTVQVTGGLNNYSTASGGGYIFSVPTRTTTKMTVITPAGGVSTNMDRLWYACGQGSTPTIKLRRCIKY